MLSSYQVWQWRTSQCSQWHQRVLVHPTEITQHLVSRADRLMRLMSPTVREFPSLPSLSDTQRTQPSLWSSTSILPLHSSLLLDGVERFLFSLIVKIPLVFEKLDKQMDHRSQLCSLPELGYICEAGWGYPAQEVSMADHLFFSHEKISVEDDELMKWTRLPLF